MDDIKFEISKKTIKALNDINQDLKTIFTEYLVYPDGIIVSSIDKYVYSVGAHLCTIDTHPIDELKSYILRLNSDNIYRAIKDYKKIIDSITIDSDMIYLSGNNERFQIGEIIELGSIKSKLIENLYLDCVKKLKSLPDNKVLLNISQEDVESLVKNEFRYASVDKYSTRVTRGVIPGLKKNHSLDIQFADSDDKRLYNMIMHVKRASVFSYHMYTCIFTK